MPQIAKLAFSKEETTTTCTLGNEITIYIRNAAAGYKYQIKATYNGRTEWLAGTGGSSYIDRTVTSIKYGVSENKILYYFKYNNTYQASCNIVFTLYTCGSDGTQLGSATATATATLNQTTPSLIEWSNATNNSANSFYSSDTRYIQSISKTNITAVVYSKVTLSSAELTISGTKYNIGSINKSTISTNFYRVTFTSAVISSGGNVELKCRVKDSNNKYSNELGNTITVYRYSKPVITNYGASRYSLSNNTLVKDDSGKYIKYYFQGSVTNISASGNTAANTGYFYVMYKRADAQWNYNDWSHPEISGYVQVTSDVQSISITQASPSEYKKNNTRIELSADYAWTIRFQIQDKAGNGTHKDLDLAVGVTTIDLLRGGRGVAVGKVAELTDTFDSAFKGLFRHSGTDALKVVNTVQNTEVGVQVTQDNGGSTTSVWMGVGQSGTWHGLYSITANKWMVYNNGTDTHVNGTADNVTGTVAIANGGTGATTAAAARTNLGISGLAIKDKIVLTTDVTGTLPIANGGTGATTSANARTNLGLKALAIKDKVTLSSDVTGTLPIANGGTGKTTAAAALTALGGLSKTGDTVEGKLAVHRLDSDALRIYHGTSNRSVGMTVDRTDTNVSMYCGIGTDGYNHGIYSTYKGGWLLYCDQNKQVHFAGTADSAAEATFAQSAQMADNVTGTVSIGHGGTGATTAAGARFKQQIYSGVTNITVQNQAWCRSKWIVPKDNGIFTDNMSIIVCPAQNVQSYDLQYYVQRFPDYKGFYIYVKNSKSSTAVTITFAWIAIPYSTDYYTES